MFYLHNLIGSQSASILWLGLVALGCKNQDTPTSAVLPSRVDAVRATAKKPAMSETDFCDVVNSADRAPEFPMPFVDPPLKLDMHVPQWISIWASWCVPCVEEMPLIQKWRSQWATQGIPVELHFISIDSSAEAEAQFRLKHPEFPAGSRMVSADGFSEWIGKTGLDSGATIPINIFLNADHKVRCARTGALKSHHHDVIGELLK